MFKHKQEMEPQLTSSRANRLGQVVFSPPFLQEIDLPNRWDLLAGVASSPEMKWCIWMQNSYRSHNHSICKVYWI